MNESIVREAIKEHREQLGRLIDALLNERDALESMRSRLCAALGLPADSAPETVAEAVEARRVVVPELTSKQLLELLQLGTDEPSFSPAANRINAWFREHSLAIPADRELMRLVDELIRWHGLRPLDKRPDHAAVLVGAIKALRANQGGAAT